jgi:hypothetical protein
MYLWRELLSTAYKTEYALLHRDRRSCAEGVQDSQYVLTASLSLLSEGVCSFRRECIGLLSGLDTGADNSDKSSAGSAKR